MLNHVLVVIQLIPDDMEFQSGDMPNYTTSDGSVSSLFGGKNSDTRLKDTSSFITYLLEVSRPFPHGSR